MNVVHWIGVTPPLGWTGHGSLPLSVPEEPTATDGFTEDLLQWQFGRKIVDISWLGNAFVCEVIEAVNDDASDWDKPLDRLVTRDLPGLVMWLVETVQAISDSVR